MAKIKISPISKAIVQEKKKKATVLLTMEDLEGKKLANFKIRIENMRNMKVFPRAADMVETMIDWYEIEGFAELHEKREKIAATAKKYLLKDYPEEEEIEMEIFDIEPLSSRKKAKK